MLAIQCSIIAQLDDKGFPFLAYSLEYENLTYRESIRYINSIAWDLSTSEYEFLVNAINDFFKPTNQPTN